MNHQILFWASVILVGITLIILVLQLLLARKSDITARNKLFLLAGVGVLPLVSLYISNQSLLEQMKEVQFCGSCHIMAHFVQSLEDPEVETLASVHVQRHRIREKSCYTCHTDYNLLGGVKAKIRGLRHLYAFYTGPKDHQPKLYYPFSNLQCLSCHQGGPTYERSQTHQEQAEEILKNKISCMECHGTAHPDFGESGS